MARGLSRVSRRRAPEPVPGHTELADRTARRRGLALGSDRASLGRPLRAPDRAPERQADRGLLDALAADQRQAADRLPRALLDEDRSHGSRRRSMAEPER